MSDELVLGLPLERLQRLGAFTGMTTSISRYLPALLDEKYLSFRPRRECEDDPSWLQLIPYIVLRHGSRVFQYTRGKKGGEQRLHALKSVGIGGHINPEDSSTADAYRVGLQRELTEEVELSGTDNERILGLIFDPSTPVGQVHLGIVHVMTLEHENVRPREASIADAGFAPIGELRRQSQAFETWSQFVLANLD